MGENGNGRAEYEAATRDLGFSKDFNASLEALMADPAAPYAQRFMAWLKRRSWGNYRLYAVVEDGKPATQGDCSRELDIDKRIVSHVVAFHEKRGYLYRDGKVLYPSLAPKLPPLPEKVGRSPDFLEFIEDWKVAHSSDFLALEVARSTVERLRKVQLSQYKEWKALRTNGGPTLYESKREIEREREEAAAASVVDIRVEPEPLPETPPPTFPDLSPEQKNGNTLSATKDPQPQPARKPAPKPKPKPATKAEPEPEPEPEPERVKPVKVEAFVEQVQAKFLENPPTISQCGRALATLCHEKLPLDGFIEHLTPERMGKINHGGALDELVKGYQATVTAKAKAPPGCPYCGCDRFDKLTGNCASCLRSREMAVLAAERRRGGT